MWRIISIILLLNIRGVVHGDPVVPCYFIFGDSLSDAGNNNALNTTAKANYAPYGVDFRGGRVTGRFTNGRTIVDVLSQLLGFQNFIPPFSTASGKQILKGVNYASGAAEFVTRPDHTWYDGDRIWLERQLQNHATTISKMQAMLEQPVNAYLNKCLYTVNIGSNDYLNNYFMPEKYPSKSKFTPDQFAQELVNQYEPQLQELYSAGARKIAVFGVAKVGCTPGEIKKSKRIGCVKEMNDAVELFNQKLHTLVNGLSKKLDGAKLTFINVGAMQAELPPLLNTNTCCKTRPDFQCVKDSQPCLVRMIHAFMDDVHPTDFVNEVLATFAYTSHYPNLVHPTNINALVNVQLDS